MLDGLRAENSRLKEDLVLESKMRRAASHARVDVSVFRSR